MKGFKKLALATAVAALSTSAFAMQPIADADLAGMTGQDGIDIAINTGALTMNQAIYDRDGIGAVAAHGMTADAAGAIVITGFGLNTNSNPINIQIDAGQGADATVPVLNVNVQLTGNTTISTGDLSVSSTNDGTTAATMWEYGINAAADDFSTSATIMSSSDITIGATSLNIQLGNVVQTMTFGGNTVNPMILLANTTVSGGIHIANTVLSDTSTATIDGAAAGSISIDDTWLVDSTATAAPGTDLTIGNVGINATTNGLAIGIGSIGDAIEGLSVYQTRVALGNATAIGDVAITGLQLSGTSIAISGH